MFPIETGKDYAVLTGDIVGSSDLIAADRRKLPEVLSEISDTLVAWLGEQVATPLALYGGDSWQLLLSNPGDALRAGLFVRASLLSSPLEIDTRWVAAVAPVDFVPETGIEQADGEAFRLSGRMLKEELRRRERMGFITPDKQAAAYWRLVFRLVDTLIRTNGTSNRARALSGALRGWASEETGNLWSPSIRRQTVDRHLEEIGWEAIEEAIQTYLASFSDAAL